MSIRKTFHDKPWLFVVVGLAFLLSLSIALLVIALIHPPELI